MELANLSGGFFPYEMTTIKTHIKRGVGFIIPLQVFGQDKERLEPQGFVLQGARQIRHGSSRLFSKGGQLFPYYFKAAVLKIGEVVGGGG